MTDTLAAGAATAPIAAGPAPVPTLAQAEAAAFVAAKPLLQSRTIWSLVVVAVATVAGHFGHQIAPGTLSAATDDLVNVMQGGGLTAAALFRVVAAKTLT